MTEEVVKYRKERAVATITLNRSEKYNTLRTKMALRLEECLRDANRDGSVRVIVLEGAGRSSRASR